MPAQLDDPYTPTHHRRSGIPPYPSAHTPLPPSITPTPLPLRAGPPATLYPFTSPAQLPPGLLAHLHGLLAAEIAAGTTYPMLDPPSLSDFGPYWFGSFGAVALAGDHAESAARLADPATDWDSGEVVLGTFYVKPNYPGRSSHVCNAGFLVAPGQRGRGVGRALGGVYVRWAADLGYSYSVFNLVYANNAASCAIWDGLGFERIGRVPGCGNLRGGRGVLVDAIIYGRRLGAAHAGLDGEGYDDREEVGTAEV